MLFRFCKLLLNSSNILGCVFIRLFVDRVWKFLKDCMVFCLFVSLIMVEVVVFFLVIIRLFLLWVQMKSILGVFFIFFWVCCNLVLLVLQVFCRFLSFLFSFSFLLICLVCIRGLFSVKELLSYRIFILVVFSCCRVVEVLFVCFVSIRLGCRLSSVFMLS